MSAVMSPALSGAPPADVLLAMARLSVNAVLLLAERGGGGATRRHEIVWANPAFDRLVGSRPGHLFGQPLSALSARLLPLDDVSTLQQGTPDVLAGILAGG